MLISFFIYVLLPFGLIHTQVVFPSDSPPRAGRQAKCRNNLQCVPIISCPFIDPNNFQAEPCPLTRKSSGICCPRRRTQNANPLPIKLPADLSARRFRITLNLPAPPRSLVNLATQFGLNFANRLVSIERNLIQRGLIAATGSREKFHQDFFGTSPIGRKIAQDGEVIHQAAKEIANQLNVSTPTDSNRLKAITLKDTSLANRCPEEPSCTSSRYRMIDGSCNNLAKPEWGKSFTHFGRLLPPQYQDGMDRPRVAKSGRPLPNARVLSASIATDNNVPNSIFSLLLMQFGQFLDHDFTLTASTRLSNGAGLVCCGPEFERDPSLLHPACFPIQVAPDDPFYRQFRQSCFTFVRSAPAPRKDCQLGPREQLNQLTSFIDGSMIYGSTVEQSRRLRTFRGGQLATSLVNRENYLPFSNNSNSCGIPRERDLRCFVGGDERVNEQLELTVMHTVWLREHNRVASILSQVNPGWNDEILYQEARRIVGAELQHITYNEFLPILIGRQVSDFFDLTPRRSGFKEGYDPQLDPSILSGFSTAAFRLHSLIQGSLEVRNDDNNILDRIDLSETFNNPSVMYLTGSVGGLVNGLSGQPIQSFDGHFTRQITNHLFRPFGASFGIDLVALNIQRGRDHGIPDYNSWREICGLNKVSDFNQLSRVLNSDAVRILSNLYESVDDIDLFVAGNLEKKLKGSLVGPTFACIIGEQFRRLKFGDRFFYENGGHESSFTEAQLKEIRKASLARILCDNSGVRAMQPLALILPLDWNKKISCNSASIPKLDFNKWQNEPLFP